MSEPPQRMHFRKPRVRLNFSRHVAGAAATGDGPKTKPYMQGYDRELDSEDDETGEGMAFEEQLVLRVPDGPGQNGELDELRRAIRKRSEYPDVWFKFKDSRRAVFYIAGQPYSAKIVDLPCIVESHKTLDNKQIFKIADISQMLLVERPIANEAEAVESTRDAKARHDVHDRRAKADDYIYPHGITPPMTWARKRRFRKRVHNRSIDTVEKEVEGLLHDDRRAERVEYEFVDPAVAEEIERECADQKYVGEVAEGLDEEDAKDGDSMRHGGGGDVDDEGEGEGDENVDQDLAAELDAALAHEQGGGEESASGSEGGGSDAQSMGDSDLEDLWDDDDDDGEAGDGGDEGAKSDGDAGDGDEGGEEEAERRVRESQLEAECREIEALLRRKQHDLESTMNALLKSRHQQALRKLQVEYDAKKRHLSDIKQIRRTMREERAAEAAAEAEARGAERSEPRSEARDDSEGPKTDAAHARSASKRE